MNLNHPISPGISRRVLFFLLLFGSFHSLSAQKKYIKEYSGLADSLQQVYGIPSSVILGVAIIESASGTSRNSRLLHNHFGIMGKNNLLKTKGVKSRYKQYPDSKSSYIDFCRIIYKRKFYSKLKGNMDYKLWIHAISRSNYSEVPDIWKERVLTAIRKHKLSTYK